MNKTIETPYAPAAQEATRLRTNADAALLAIEREFAGRSWREVAPLYFAAQQAAGQAEMTALLDALAVEPPVDAKAAGQILAVATRIFLGSRPGDAGLAPIQDGMHFLQVDDCPVYHRLLEERPPHQPGGVTACSCTYRRRGWYDVLGIVAWDEPQTNMKWGDPYCSVVINIA